MSRIGMTPEIIGMAQAAVGSATCEVSPVVVDEVQRWIRKNTGFDDLADMMCSAIRDGYNPTIRPVAASAKAYRDAERVANAFDAACTWAFGAGTHRKAYRPDAAPLFTRRGA